MAKLTQQSTVELLKHDAMYKNKEKATNWQYSGRQQSPMALSSSDSTGNIPNEMDVVKLKGVQFVTHKMQSLLEHNFIILFGMFS